MHLLTPVANSVCQLNNESVSFHFETNLRFFLDHKSNAKLALPISFHELPDHFLLFKGGNLDSAQVGMSLTHKTLPVSLCLKSGYFSFTLPFICEWQETINQ
ncbi:hypothetical protein V6Z12_A04G174500 [Gossypium hirsutum]